MTKTTNARIAGITFLIYIAIGITGMVLQSQATVGGTITAKLASISQHVLQMRLVLICGLLEPACAIVLAATLYSITRDVDRDLALLGLLFRFGEGLIGAIASRSTLESLWLVTLGATGSPNHATVEALGTYVLQAPRGGADAIFFAVGSTLFSFLLLRGRKIPVILGWLGVGASGLLAVALPMQFAEFLSARIVAFLWIPMALYEVPLGVWLVTKGVTSPRTRQEQTPARV